MVDLSQAVSYEKNDFNCVNDEVFYDSREAISYARRLTKQEGMNYEPFESRYHSSLNEMKSMSLRDESDQDEAPQNFSQVNMDEFDAAMAAMEWLNKVKEKHDLTRDSGAEIKHNNIENNNGKIISLWQNNRPIATAVLLRDAFNYTTLCCNEHQWD